jgi:F0F1-type ATP synthase membrane subunit b/b'
LDDYDNDESDANHDNVIEKSEKYRNNFNSFKTIIPEEMKYSIRTRINKISEETDKANEAKQESLKKGGSYKKSRKSKKSRRSKKSKKSRRSKKSKKSRRSNTSRRR